jgi:predicted transcriptional regulator
MTTCNEGATAMPSATDKIVPTSLKLPASLKAQIDESARKAGVSAHAFMLKTLGDATERMRLREQFHQDALDALHGMEATGLAYDFEDVRAYFSAKAAARKAGTPEPAKPVLKPWRGAV